MVACCSRAESALRTMTWYNELQFLADGGHSESSDDVRVVDARAKLGVLRTIFAGGLMTPDPVARHRKQGEPRTCRCGLDRNLSSMCLGAVHSIRNGD